MRAQAGGWSEGDVRQGFDTRVRDSTVWICERSSYWSLVGPDEPLLSEERRSAAILERATVQRPKIFRLQLPELRERS